LWQGFERQTFCRRSGKEFQPVTRSVNLRKLALFCGRCQPGMIQEIEIRPLVGL
jgi:hypothetical protein